MSEVESAMSDVRTAGIVVTVTPQVGFAALAARIENLGVCRDPDRTDVATGIAGEPSFASWSASEGDDLEIDYHYDQHAGTRWLEVRGEDAAKRAAELAALLGGSSKGTVAELLAELMTPPRRTAGDRLGATGTLRWHAMRDALASAGPANMQLIVPMVRAGLRDPDWRMRMTAILAVGKLRLAALADAAIAAKVPSPGQFGVGSEDHRTLLALRQAAHDRAKGLPPSSGPGEDQPPDIAEKRRIYQEHLHGLLDGKLPGRAASAALMMSALLEPGCAGESLYPLRWRRWLERAD